MLFKKLSIWKFFEITDYYIFKYTFHLSLAISEIPVISFLLLYLKV